MFFSLKTNLLDGVTKETDKNKFLKQEAAAKASLEEWQQRHQSHPCFTIFLFLVSMVIVAFSTFYTKIMIHYENSNPYESFYALNGLNLIFIGMIIKFSIDREVSKLVKEYKSN